MKNSLFLHFGPGANAYVERSMFSDALPNVNFWDQPSTKGASDPFCELVHLTEIQISHLAENKSLIAHSFGVEIALALMGRPIAKDFKKIILISPIRDLKKSFCNLAENLNKIESNSNLSLAIGKIKELPSAESFWNLAGQVSAHSSYHGSFWKKLDVMQNYFKIAASGLSFDSVEWQTTINQILFTSPLNSNYDLFSGLPVQVILGDGDPYYNLQEETEYWSNLIGKQNVHVLPNCGHLPHIENPEFLIDKLNQ